MAGIELEVVGRLQVLREPLLEVLLELGPPRGQEVVAGLARRVDLALERLGLGLAGSPGRSSRGSSSGSTELAKTP